MTVGRKSNRKPETPATSVPEEAILGAALDVFRRLDFRELLEAASRHAAAWTGASAVAAVAFDEEAGAPGVVAATVPLDRPVLAPLRATAAAGTLEAAADDPTPPKLVLHDGSGRIAAVLALWDVDPSAPSLLRPFAAAIVPAIDNALQVRAIRELTIRDDTAECYNRRHFEEFLVEELARANRFKTPMSLIFFDMDNLKEVNNRLGHAMGSRTLLEVSRRVRSKIRKFDKLFRFGGDEFCIVLPETEWHGALEVAERVREAIASRPMLEHEPAGEGGVSMTASFGIASFPLHARAKEGLVVRADRAMQSVKSTSKNSIAVAELENDGVR